MDTEVDDSEVELTDEELTAEALAADPDAPIDDDAVPFDTGAANGMQLLPDWYMPAPSLRRSRVACSCWRRSQPRWRPAT